MGIYETYWINTICHYVVDIYKSMSSERQHHTAALSEIWKENCSGAGLRIS
jgi:hypothetical protein